MEQYGEYKPGKALLVRVGSGKVDQDERLLMLVPPNVFGDTEKWLDKSVEDGLEELLVKMDEDKRQCILNEDSKGVITAAPYESVRDLIYSNGRVKDNVYIASASPGGPPRVEMGDKIRNHIAYNDGSGGEGTEFNVLNLVVNTEKDIQG